MERMSSSEFPWGEDEAAHRPATFEETYPRYEFAELVCLALAAGAWLLRERRRVVRRRPDATEPLPGDMRPAD